jgi:hypothetical protein
VKLSRFFKACPLFPDTNNGATFVPESETSLAGPFFLVSLKNGGKNIPRN